MVDGGKVGKKADGIGARVRAVREGRSLAQQELAERAGITVPQLSRIENGHMRPRAKTARHLAEALGVPVEMLTGAGGLLPRFNGTPAADAVSEGRGEH